MIDPLSLGAIASYITVGSLIIGVVLWARSLMSKINAIETNHLSHIEAYSDETRIKTSEIAAGQARLEKHAEQQTALLTEQTKLLVEIKTVLQERA